MSRSFPDLPSPGPIVPLRAAAAALEARLCAMPGLREAPDPVAGLPGEGERFRWRNLIAAAPAFRRAHLEWLEVPGRLAVLHLCIFPHLEDATPVLGFDVVAGHARVTGAFLDLSPVVPGPPRPSLADLVGADALAGFAEPRARPDWGDIFSAEFLAVRPDGPAELARVLDLAEQALDGTLAHLAAGRGRGADPDAVAEGQAAYVAGQRRNEHTPRMLAGLVGAEAARRFVEDHLFPAPPRPLVSAGS